MLGYEEYENQKLECVGREQKMLKSGEAMYVHLPDCCTETGVSSTSHNIHRLDLAGWLQADDHTGGKYFNLVIRKLYQDVTKQQQTGEFFFFKNNNRMYQNY